VSRIELASYEPGDKEAYLELLREAWAERALTRAEFAWWFERNPEGSLMSVARDGGRVVGVAAHSLFRMILDGEEQTASFSVHATTHESVRGRGVFRDLEAKHEREAQERGVAVVLAFASAPTAPLFLGPLGWTQIARYRVWARPLLGRGTERTSQHSVTKSFGTDGDAAAAWPNHIVRDPRYLQWRYAESPRDYEVLRSDNGYAVVWRRGSTALLADLAPGSAMLRRAVRAARGRVLVGVPAPQQRSTFLAHGFLPSHKSLHFMGKALAGHLNTDPSAWRFTLGDTDFF
jgi:hypothetical protein